MRRILIVVVLVIGAAVLGLWRSHGGVRAGMNRVVGASADNSQAVNDEIRKTFQLKAGAHVEIQGINGSVDVQTSDTNTAEVYVRRSAENSDSLARRAMIVEQTSDGFIVRSKQNQVSLWDHLFGKDPKEEVTIKAPRQIALSMRGVNGRISTGDVDGGFEIRGVNGRVDLGSTSEALEISGVNGPISVGLKQLGEHATRISGVNGTIELRLANGLNAELNARGMNGSVRSEIPEVTVDREDNWSRYSARIGSGGPVIEISGINGNVKLTRLSGPAAAANTTGGDKKKPQKSEHNPATAPKSGQ